MITLVIAHHGIIRKGLRLILESQPDFKVVGEAIDSIETKRIIEELKPSVLVTSGSFDGLELTRMVTEGHPSRTDSGTNVVVLLGSSEKSHLHRALRAGAKACILVDSGPEELINAIREVANDRYYLSPQLLQDFIRDLASRVTDNYDTLTVREKQILRLVGRDYSNEQIAQYFGISRRTVEIHRMRMMKKMGFDSRSALIRYAVENGIRPAAEQPSNLKPGNPEQAQGRHARQELANSSTIINEMDVMTHMGHVPIAQSTV